MKGNHRASKLLAVLKAGGAYVPLDPAFPWERLAFMAEDACLQVLLTQERLAALLPVDAPVIYLDADRSAISQLTRTNPASGVAPHNLAYVIYTSGSTGKPKGVEVLNSGVVNLLSSMRERPGIGGQDRLGSDTRAGSEPGSNAKPGSGAAVLANAGY